MNHPDEHPDLAQTAGPDSAASTPAAAVPATHAGTAEAPALRAA